MSFGNNIIMQPPPQIKITFTPYAAPLQFIPTPTPPLAQATINLFLVNVILKALTSICRIYYPKEKIGSLLLLFGIQIGNLINTQCYSSFTVFLPYCSIAVTVIQRIQDIHPTHFQKAVNWWFIYLEYAHWLLLSHTYVAVSLPSLYLKHKPNWMKRNAQGKLGGGLLNLLQDLQKNCSMYWW